MQPVAFPVYSGKAFQPCNFRKSPIKPDGGEGSSGLGVRFRHPLRTQAIAIPFLRQSPYLFEAQNGSARLIPLVAPAVNMLYRPEQEHGFSGEDNILVPLAGRNGKMADALARQQVTVPYIQHHFEMQHPHEASTRASSCSIAGYQARPECSCHTMTSVRFSTEMPSALQRMARPTIHHFPAGRTRGSG
jgi:hypothetical protein